MGRPTRLWDEVPFSSVVRGSRFQGLSKSANFWPFSFALTHVASTPLCKVPANCLLLANDHQLHVDQLHVTQRPSRKALSLAGLASTSLIWPFCPTADLLKPGFSSFHMLSFQKREINTPTRGFSVSTHSSHRKYTGCLLSASTVNFRRKAKGNLF